VLREDFDLGTTTISSPSGAVNAGYSLVSVPLQPVNPDPAAVFAGTQIDWWLYKWERATQSQIPYDIYMPGAFGNIQTDEGYWLYQEAPYTISYQAYGGVPAMRDTSLPTAGWNILGCPFLRNAPWEDIQVTYSGITTTMQHAAKDVDKLWLNSNGIWWDSATQSQMDIGIPEDYPTTLDMSPWHGYWVNTFVNDLTLTLTGNKP
jgi:hypothetical protein